MGLRRRFSGALPRARELRSIMYHINSSLLSGAHLEYRRVAKRPGEREPAGQFQELHEEVFVEVEVLQLASSLQRTQLDVLHREVLGESAREISRRVRQNSKECRLCRRYAKRRQSTLNSRKPKRVRARFHTSLNSAPLVEGVQFASESFCRCLDSQQDVLSELQKGTRGRRGGRLIRSRANCLARLEDQTRTFTHTTKSQKRAAGKPK